MINKRKQGELFEEYALEFYKSLGYDFLAKNYFTKYGEIDLIVSKESLIVFVEVKQRTSDMYGSGEYAIDYRKKRRIFLSARDFIFKNKYYDYDIRFDAVIFKDSKKPCNWIKDIIWGDELEF